MSVTGVFDEQDACVSVPLCSIAWQPGCTGEQENIREADKRRERMEAKLDDLIHALLERDRSDSEKKSAEEEKSPISGTPGSIPSSYSAPGEEPVRRASVVRGRGGNRTRNSVADESTAQEDCAKDSDHEDID